jgi:hypothetical protein
MSKDKQTLELIELIKKQKKEIADVERPNWKTNCSFSMGMGCQPVNIQVEPNIGTLINIAAFLLRSNNSYVEVINELSVVDPPIFKHQGYTLDDWIHDINVRIKKIQIKLKKDKLEKLESRLNNIISPELKAQLELEDIQKELGV